MTRALGLACLDLGNGRDLDPVYISTHIDKEAERFNRMRAETGVAYIDCFPQVDEQGLPFTNNHPDPTVRERYREIWRGFFQFAAAVGLEGVTLSPGRYWPGESSRASVERAAEELRWAVDEGGARGLRVRIEPHIESVTWRPELVLDMLEAVPGLTLTLDHSHFIFHALPYEQISALHRHATHWHARQARPGRTQCRERDGQIDFARIVRELRADRYDGALCLEYVHSAWLDQDNVDCLTETVALRDTLRKLIAL